jgi:aminomethyltransferase
LLRKSPLHYIHQNLKAKFTEFSGFEMPLQFTSIKDEHLQVRRFVGLFDVSHMSNVWITGKEAEDLITLTTIEDASRIDNNKSQYTALLREDGTIIDDTIFMHLDEKYMIIPNAGMDKIVTDWLNKKAGEYNLSAKAINGSEKYVILAVQGPKSKETLQKLMDEELNKIGFFGCKYTKIANEQVIISHTGYTGELGFELQISPIEKASFIFNKILESGREFDIKPIGLGARDTLRLEKCFLLAGNEFKGGRTPLEAMMSWVLNWNHEFIGKNALIKQKEEDTYRRITCLQCIDKGIPRHGNEVTKNGKIVGVISSGSLSPCLNKGIALAYIDPDNREVGSSLNVKIRGKSVETIVVKPPFVKKDWIQHQ